MTGFRLVPLDCPSCGAPMAGEEEDLVFYCTACRNGHRWDPEAAALVPIEVTFLPSPTVPAAGHLPFWLVPARVEIERSAGGLGKLLELFGGGDGGHPGEGEFAIPAYRLPLPRLVELALAFTRELPSRLDPASELLAERLTGGTLPAEDAVKLAHYVLIAAETRRPDTLRDLRYSLEPRPARLLGVPWVKRGGTRVDAVLGLPV